MKTINDHNPMMEFNKGEEYYLIYPTHQKMKKVVIKDIEIQGEYPKTIQLRVTLDGVTLSLLYVKGNNYLNDGLATLLTRPNKADANDAVKKQIHLTKEWVNDFYYNVKDIKNPENIGSVMRLRGVKEQEYYDLYRKNLKMIKEWADIDEK